MDLKEREQVEEYRFQVFEMYSHAEPGSQERKALYDEWKDLLALEQSMQTPKQAKWDKVTKVLSVIGTILGAAATAGAGAADIYLKKKAIDDNRRMFEEGLEYEKTGTFTTMQTKSRCVTKPNKVF